MFMAGREEEEARIQEAYRRRAEQIPSDRYALYRPGPIQNRALQLEHVARALARADMLPFGERRILEVGCGQGQWLIDFESMGALRERLAGIDLVESRLDIARRRLSGADLRLGSAAELPWEAKAFDVVFQSTVFTSILDGDLKRAIAREMLRVVKPGGVILWYDFMFDNPSNRDVRGIGRSEIRELFPGCTIDLDRVTLAPPIGRRLAAFSRELASLLERIKLFNTHLLGVIRP